MSKSGGGKEQGGRPASVSTPKTAPSVRMTVPSIGKYGNVSPNSSKRGKDQKVGA